MSPASSARAPLADRWEASAAVRGRRPRGALRRPLPRPAGQHRGHHLPRGCGRAPRASDEPGHPGPGVSLHHHAMPAVAPRTARALPDTGWGSRWTSAAPSSSRDTARRPRPSPGSVPWARAYSCSALTTPVATGTRAGGGHTSKDASAWRPSPRASTPPAWTRSQLSCGSAAVRGRRGAGQARTRCIRRLLPPVPGHSPRPARRGTPGRAFPATPRRLAAPSLGLDLASQRIKAPGWATARRWRPPSPSACPTAVIPAVSAKGS